MFTGIIQNFGELKSMIKHSGEARLVFRFQKKEKHVQKGESIAVNGVCLTAVRINASGFEADLVPETLAATNLGKLTLGERVNLERSLRIGDPVGGHIVMGHVDTVGKIAEICRRGKNWSLLVDAPATIISQLAVKGSVACDGVSLTVQAIMPKRFRVAVIPHTLAVTTLGKKKAGDEINLESDILMRRSKRFTHKPAKNSFSVKKLRMQGF